jgi:hypothetical protein
MTAILTVNAVSTFLAAIGMSGYLIVLNRRARGDTAVQPAYVPGRTIAPLRH